MQRLCDRLLDTRADDASWKDFAAFLGRKAGMDAGHRIGASNSAQAGNAGRQASGGTIRRLRREASEASAT